MPSKKRLLILSSTGGYGHIAAANTLETLLADAYEIDVIYPINELRICKLRNGEALYNFFLTNNFTRFANWVIHWLPPLIFQKRTEKTTRLIESHIRKKRSDLLISLIPFINFPAIEAAKRARIPFLLVTTDNDLHNWVYDLQKRESSPLKVTIGSALPTSKGTLLAKKVLEEEIVVTGLPLRCEFLTSHKSKEILRSEYEIPQDKHVLLIMMGGTGARLSYQYVKHISQELANLHIIVCTGRNHKIAKKLKSIRPLEGNVIHIVPFTEKVQELFILSDLILTKPGPGTINEAISCKLPILIDRIHPPMFWEEANITLVEKLGIGRTIYQLKDASKMIHQFLFDNDVREKIRSAYENISPTQFAQTIKPIIEMMITQKEEEGYDLIPDASYPLASDALLGGSHL